MRVGLSRRSFATFCQLNAQCEADCLMPAVLLDQTLWLNVFFAAEWPVRLAMIVVVPFRRSPEAAKGWLLLIFFEPTIGLILYALIGRPKLPQWRIQRHLEFDELSRPILERVAREPNIFHP